MTSFSSYNFPPVTELVFPTEWESTDHDDKMMFAETEDLLTYQPSSHHVLGGSQWEDYQDANADQDMQTDGDNIFPTRPLEELFNNALYFDNDDDHHHHNHNHNIHYQAGQDQFLDPLMNDGVDTTDHDLLLCDDDDSSTASIGLPLEERYKATLEKLQASMKRSQETRNCLSMKTVTTESYERVGSVKEILSSITASSNQVQKYVTSIQRPL